MVRVGSFRLGRIANLGWRRICLLRLRRVCRLGLGRVCSLGLGRVRGVCSRWVGRHFCRLSHIGRWWILLASWVGLIATLL